MSNSRTVPGLHFGWEDGAEVQRADEDGLYEGDMEAALALAAGSDFRWMAYLEPGVEGNSWSIHAFREREVAEAFLLAVASDEERLDQRERRTTPHDFVFDGRDQAAVTVNPRGYGYRCAIACA